MQANNKKILVVEDENSLRGALKDKLRHEGYNVIEAKNGEEGLMMALKESPDLIMLDILMPVMDGTDMLKELRRTEEGKDIPVMVLTNVSDMGKMYETMVQGSFNYFVKSDWKLEDIVDKVREILTK